MRYRDWWHARWNRAVSEVNEPRHQSITSRLLHTFDLDRSCWRIRLVVSSIATSPQESLSERAQDPSQKESDKDVLPRIWRAQASTLPCIFRMTPLCFECIYRGGSMLADTLQAFTLLHEEGFCVGASSGLNVEAAVQVARDLGPGHTVVTLLCDSGLVS